MYKLFMYILSSIGLSYEPVQTYISTHYKVEDLCVAIVTTAAEGKDSNKYSLLAKQQFTDLGVKNIFFFDLEFDDMSILEKTNCIYVCGGNTYYLAEHAKRTNFATYIDALMKRGGLYVGVSAGSILVGPDISIAGIGEWADSNDIELTDLTGLGLVSFVIKPHYELSMETDVLNYETSTGLTVTRLENERAVVINGNAIESIEENIKKPQV